MAGRWWMLWVLAGSSCGGQTLFEFVRPVEMPAGDEVARVQIRFDDVIVNDTLVCSIPGAEVLLGAQWLEDGRCNTPTKVEVFVVMEEEVWCGSQPGPLAEDAEPEVVYDLLALALDCRRTTEDEFPEWWVGLGVEEPLPLPDR